MSDFNYQTRPIMESKMALIRWVRTHHDIGLRGAKESVEVFFDAITERERDSSKDFLLMQRATIRNMLTVGDYRRASAAAAANNKAELVAAAGSEA